MNLGSLRTEVLAHGFDPILFQSRITDYLNDAQSLVARRVDYYVDEATSQFATVAGTSTYAFPTDFARARSLFLVDFNVELQYVGIRDIDRSPPSNATPVYYAIDRANVHLYPTPNDVFHLELRYWQMPTPLVNDSDVPTMPLDWHRMLWVYAVALCYEAEDDPQQGQYWMKRFTDELAMFSADQKFPDTDGPIQAKGMWETEQGLGAPGWARWGV